MIVQLLLVQRSILYNGNKLYGAVPKVMTATLNVVVSTSSTTTVCCLLCLNGQGSTCTPALCCLLCLNGQGIVRAAKPLFVAVVALCGTAVTNNGAIAEP